MSKLKWTNDSPSGTARAAFYDTPHPDAAIAKLEAHADKKGDWEYDEDTGYNWYGLVGTYDDILFTLYTHKSGTIKIGAFPHAAPHLDLAGLKAALDNIVLGVNLNA